MLNQKKEYAKLLQMVNNANTTQLINLLQFLSLQLHKPIVECRHQINMCKQEGYIETEKATFKVTQKGLEMIASIMPIQRTKENSEGVNIALGITESNSNKHKETSNIFNESSREDNELQDLKEQIEELKKGQQRLLSLLEQKLDTYKPKPNFIKSEDVMNNVLAFGYIYGTYDIKTNNLYIGQSKKLDKYSLENYKGSGIYIAKELKERPNDFKKYILRVCYNQQELDKWEIILIEYYKSRNPNNGYNEQIGGTDRVESIHFAKQIGVDFDDLNTIKEIHKEQTNKEKQYRANNETKG